MEINRNVSIVKDSKGKDIVLINDIQFKGKRKVDWNEVKEYLYGYVGDIYEISNTDDYVYIGTDLPDEYTGSEYTESLRGGNAKAKANATQGIPELLNIATGKFYRENTTKKHLRDARYGWYRYDSRFALPVFADDGRVERYNLYHASLLIRHASENKLYLYDVIDIKKETSNPLGLNGLPDKKPIS